MVAPVKCHIKNRTMVDLGGKFWRKKFLLSLISESYNLILNTAALPGESKAGDWVCATAHLKWHIVYAMAHLVCEDQ